MTKPYDRPAREPGGVECQKCGRIFIGEEWHTKCAVCHESTSMTPYSGLRGERNDD